MSIEEIAAKGILGLRAPPPKVVDVDITVDVVDVVDEQPKATDDAAAAILPAPADSPTDSSGSNVPVDVAVDVVSLATPTDYGRDSNDDANKDDEDVPISTDTLPPGSNLDDVPLPSLDDDDDDEKEQEGGGDLITDGTIQVNEAVVENQEAEQPVPAAEPAAEEYGTEEEIAAAAEAETAEQSPPPPPPEGTVAGSGSTEKDNLIWPDDATHEAVPEYTATPKRKEIEPMVDEGEEVEAEAEAEAETETGEDGTAIDAADGNEFEAVDEVAVDAMETSAPVPEEEVVVAPSKPLDQPIIVLDAPPTTTTTTDDDETPSSYETVTAEEYAQEFSIVLEKCDDGSGFASNDAAAAAAAADEDGDFTSNPCVRSEPTFVGCTDADLFSAANPFDDAVIKTTVAFNYDLYLRYDAVVEDAVEQLEETMLQHVAGGMNFDRCGADNADNADDGGRRLFAQEDKDKKKDAISFVGLSSRPVDARDATFQQCTSNLSIEGDVPASDTKCVPMKGKMTLYLSSKEDRFAAKHLIKTMVKSGAEDGSFVGGGGGGESGNESRRLAASDKNDNDILGVAYVENRALDAARMPGSNLEQFKASAGMSGLAIGLVSFLGVFASCFAFGLVGMRRNKRIREHDDSINEEADSAELVKGEDGSFPTFPQLAKITPSGDTESEVDLENPDQPIPTLTKTGSSELLSIGSAEFGCSADDATVEAANPRETEPDPIFSIPLPVADNKNWAAAGATAAILADDAGDNEESESESEFDDIPRLKSSGSMDFGTISSSVSVPSKMDGADKGVLC